MSLSEEEQRRFDDIERQFRDDEVDRPAGPDLGAARRRRQIRARWLLGIGAAVILLGLDMVSEGADGGLVVMVYGVLALCAAAVARRRSGG